MQIRVLALDAFGTLIQYGQRRAHYGRLLAGQGEGAARLPFLTRDVPVATFAAELGLEHLLPDIEADLAEELESIRICEKSANSGRGITLASRHRWRHLPQILMLSFTAE